MCYAGLLDTVEWKLSDTKCLGAKVSGLSGLNLSCPENATTIRPPANSVQHVNIVCCPVVFVTVSTGRVARGFP